MITNLKPISRYYRSIGPEYSKIYNDREMIYLGMAHMPLIIGITGPTKSGKTMVAKYLVTEHGFHYECLSSFLRERASALGYLSPNWEKMRDIAKQWRSEAGPAVLVNMLFKKLEREGILRSARSIVVDGILHPEEFLALQKLPNTHLIAITSKAELRHKSIDEWAKDSPTWEEFVKRDQWECGFREGDQKLEDEEPNINECIRLTPEGNRFEREENESREELFEQVDAFLKKARVHSQ